MLLALLPVANIVGPISSDGTSLSMQFSLLPRALIDNIVPIIRVNFDTKTVWLPVSSHVPQVVVKALRIVLGLPSSLHCCTLSLIILLRIFSSPVPEGREFLVDREDPIELKDALLYQNLLAIADLFCLFVRFEELEVVTNLLLQLPFDYEHELWLVVQQMHLLENHLRCQDFIHVWPLALLEHQNLVY